MPMPISVPSPVPVPLPIHHHHHYRRRAEPGSPVTPPLSDPTATSAATAGPSPSSASSTGDGLHLLCLAANASPEPMQAQVKAQGQAPPQPSPQVQAHVHPQVQAPHLATMVAGQPPVQAAHPPYAYAPALPAPFSHLGFMAPSYLPLPTAVPTAGVPAGVPAVSYYAPYYPSAPVALRVVSDGALSPNIGGPVGVGVGVRKVKGPWRKEEDELLTALVGRFGARRWTTIAAHIPGRTGKQARERWLNQLSPDLVKRPWSAEEDRVVMDAHARLGNRWSEIAKLLKGRTDNAVKNRFNTTIRRQISELSSSAAGATTTNTASGTAVGKRGAEELTQLDSRPKTRVRTEIPTTSSPPSSPSQQPLYKHHHHRTLN